MDETPELLNSHQERHPSRETGLVTEDESEVECLASHCPPPGMADCDWPKCAPLERLVQEDF